MAEPWLPDGPQSVSEPSRAVSGRKKNHEAIKQLKFMLPAGVDAPPLPVLTQPQPEPSIGDINLANRKIKMLLYFFTFSLLVLSVFLCVASVYGGR